MATADVKLVQTMAHSRFFFADAAVQQFMIGTDDLLQVFEESKAVVRIFHRGLIAFIVSFLVTRRDEIKEKGATE